MLPSAVVRGRRTPLHFGFALRLSCARKAAAMSGVALSRAVEMTTDTVWRLEAGGRHPRIDTIEKLASVLSISPGLLAYGIESACEPTPTSLSSGLPARLAQLRQQRGFSCRELGRFSDTSHNFVQMTETGTTVPSIAKVEQLATALQVSPSWLAFGICEQDFVPPRRSRLAATTLPLA